MKKIFIIALIAVIALSFASCGKQSDPGLALNDYLEICKNAAGAATLLKNEDYLGAVADYPEIEEQYKKLAEAYVRSINFSVDENNADVDKKAGTAQYTVIINAFDYKTLINVTERELGEWILEYQLSEYKYPTNDEINEKRFEISLGLVEQAGILRTDYIKQVQLKLDKDSGEWTVVDPDAILGEFKLIDKGIFYSALRDID